MKSYEALERATNKIVNDVAKRLRLSTSLIYKWREPHTDYTDSGARNPLDDIETIIETSLLMGNSPEDALSPIQYLTERFNLIFLNPPGPKPCNQEISKDLLSTIKEFGEMAGAAGKALKDGKINQKEATIVIKEAWELIRQTAVFIKKIEEAIK